MSPATLCTCIREGLTVVVDDDECPATILHLTHPKETP